MFQSSQPVVHVLYQKANELVRQCMLLFMKPDVVAEKEGHDLTEVNCEQSKNWLESGRMAIGSGTERALKSVPDSKRKEILLAVRACLKITTVYLQQHLPISRPNPVLCDLQCLHPLGTVQKLCNDHISHPPSILKYFKWYLCYLLY